MGIHDEVLAWACSKLPKWRQDALRRLYADSELTQTDLDELYDLARQEHDLPPSTDPLLSPAPFSQDDFPSEPQAEHQVALTSLHTLVNVGRIPSDQSIPFLPTGLTIVYGGNATGKSGYARVLKQACRARSPGTVYANAFAPNYSDLIPSAKIDFTADGKPDYAVWESGKPCRNELRAVSVFDSDCAGHYLRNHETATFQPTAFGYLQQLALGISKELGKRVDAELRTLRTTSSAFDEIPEDTEAGKAIRPLTAKTDLAKVASLADISTEESVELEKLPSEIAEADPTTKAENLDNNATKLDEILGALKKVQTTVSNDRVTELRELRQRLSDAEAAEKAAAAALQNEDPKPLLAGTGEGAWAIFFNAAREFSLCAYPAHDFPVVEEGSHCLLCQQKLDPDARVRLSRFNTFIHDKASSTAMSVRAGWEKQAREVHETLIPAAPSQTILASLAKRTQELPQQITDLLSDLGKRLGWLREAVNTNIWAGIPTYTGPDPLPSIAAIATDLRQTAKCLRENLDATLLATKRKRLKELQSRQLLKHHQCAIESVVHDAERQTKLTAVKADIARTRGISDFAKQLAKGHISDSLAVQMNEEVRRLDLHHIGVGVTFDGDYGAVRLRVILPNSSLSPHQVLSEAEQRMCSLAYFFAEQQQSKSTSAVVFDDPVTSLDHSHRTAVARRIVDEAAMRQVIVFTHDAVFFGELRLFAEESALVAHEIKSVEHRAEGPGFIDASLPWDLRNHKDRIVEHRKRHSQLAASFNNPPGETERLAMRNAYDDLRATIEIGIEEVILNQTVVRFRDNLSVGRLSGVTQVEDAEFTEIARLHDRCCRQVRAHAHAAGQQRSVPQPSDLLTDLDAIDALLRGIKKRRSKG